MKKNAFYAQSGGVTSVINASACGVIEAARKHKDKINKVYAGRNGILGALIEDMTDTSRETSKTIAQLLHTPGGVFGSARFKLQDLRKNKDEYHRLIQVFKKHNIGYFFYNGGGDSMDTAHKVSLIGKKVGFPIVCIGIPKTVDNDLPFTDTCPGFGSAAKYIAVSTKEAGLDVASMAKTSTKVFILEVMGRHAGWLAAAGGLANETRKKAPQIILFPEIPFDKKEFLKEVNKSVKNNGYCVIVVSEGAKNKKGKFLAEIGTTDAFGHSQLGGVAINIADIIKNNLGYKYHYAIADYLQRSARHISSKTDVEQAYQVGKKAVELALEGRNSVMPTIIRKNDSPYKWTTGYIELNKVANKERMMPRKFISTDGFHITAACRRYMVPLINGEDYPPYKNGIPITAKLKNIPVDRMLKEKFMIK
ncbi:MAG: 6-phosphofructokinase [Gammaproteobacteria bacterium TMED78]|nr:MAG: 6-phosphofructokinase [Gammaproteobacteria bacterium TMED78]|tara:strand:+ start:104540 stop:105802 length:1263 start_codon:yes stop_codon:yes gene_type:complete